MIKKKIISFSIWGNIRLYCIGAIKNALLAKKIFPDWICRFYYDTTVPKIVIEYLNKLDNTELVLMNDYDIQSSFYKKGNTFGSLWRFLVCIDKTIDMYLVCDTDSRINTYLKLGVLKMLEKKKQFVRFVDLPSNYKISAGAFGGIHNAFTFSENELNQYKYGEFYCDQKFLNDIVYPQIKNNCITFPRVKHNSKLFIKDIVGNFIGEVLNEYDIPIDKNGDQSFNFKTNYDDLEELLDKYKTKINTQL